MSILINPKLSQVFANDTQQQKFIAAALEQILGEEKTEALITEILPQEVRPSPKFKGQPLVLFNGLTRAQLKSLHGFTDEEVDEVFSLMGVKEVETKSEATVNREAVESAGTASERKDIPATTQPVVVTEGETEAEVDARAASDKTADAKPAAKPVQAKATQTKGK